MKRLLLLICTLLCANVLLAQPTVGSILIREGVQYRIISENEAEVYGYVYDRSSIDILSIVTWHYEVPGQGIWHEEYSVTSIGETAFYNCSSLTSVTIPNSVTSIGYGAFAYCSSLTSVTIGNSVTSIGECAFYNCSSLTSITIPNSVTSIGGGVFYNCSSLTSVNLSNNITELPYYYEGGIAYGFFSGCSSLTSIDIPNSVTSIGVFAFDNCSGLTSVNIGNGVTSIGQNAFSDCSSLTSVTIPNSVTSIGYGAFSNCSSLTTLNFNAINCNDFVDDYYQPFYNTSITTINIGDSVQRIPAYFVYNLNSLTSVTIGNSVTSIGSRAFSNCSSLTTLNFNAINCEDFTSDYDDRTFCNCPITTINIGNSVQRIPAYFACSLNSLTSIDIPNSVTSIGYLAFWDCSGLTSITIPNSVTSIGGAAFAYCSSLTSVTLSNNITELPCYYAGSDAYGFFDNCISLNSITIPNSITHIGEYAFFNCISLTSIDIPNSVTSIVAGAFAYCSSLNSVNIPNSVTSIGNYTFYNCSSLSSVNIGNSVTSIDEGTFYNCSGLTSVTIPNSVTTIGNSAFASCSSLTSVYIPNSVTSIGSSAFSDCSSLTSVTIPNSVTSIDEGTFYNCSGLTSVTIGNSVTSIGAAAFSGCNFLQNITCLSTIPPTMTSNNVFPYPNMAFVSVPCGSLSAYTAPTSFWNMFFMDRIQESNFAINLIVNNSEWGTVSMERTNCSTVILTATANEGYHFESWSDGETANPRTLVMTEDTEITAIFEEQEVITYNVTTGVNNEIMGSVEGAGIYVENTTATLTAVANYGYHFVAWSDGETANPRTITVTSDVNLTANFAINTYELVANVNNQSMGSVTGAGEYDYLSQVTLTAMANVGHHFVSWNDGNTNNPRTIVLTSDTIITANFEVNTYTIIANVENDAMGTVSGGGEYTYGSTATLTAVPNACFSFVAWNDGNTENPRTITVSDNASLTASFEAVVYEHSFTANICEGTTYSENGFNVSEAGTYTQTFQTVNGCDSVVTLTLNVNSILNTELSANICQGQVYNENGFNVSEAGVYTQTLTSVNGCDSIVTLTLNVNPIFNTELSATICQGQVYTENNFNVSEAGVYTQTLTSVNGCDSIVTLTLNVNPTFNTELSATICQGQTYAENGFNVSEAGVYTQTLTSANGCDSIVTLTVSVNPTFDTTINATINAGETYAEFGFNESEAGTYVQNLQTEFGCDSTITLILDVNSSLMDVEQTEISFYPNPTDSKITFSSTIESIEVIDQTGRCVLTFSNAREINIESLPSGAYYLRLTNKDKAIMRKVIKE